MKQTAIDWLFEELNVFGFQYNETSVTAPKEIWEKIYKKAKEMEKQQIENSFLDGYKSHPYLAEQYYQETYEKDA